MPRALLLSLLILALAPAVAAAESVKLLECAPAAEAAHRSATFEARMRRERGSERMQVRFTLQVHDGVLPGWRRIAASGFDQWLTSDPGVSRYTYSKTVRNLAAPASYRTVVRFRWLDDGGELLGRSRAASRTCRQPDMRPDLAATRIDAVDGGYAVTVHNAGRGAAGAFPVTLSAGAEQLAPLTVAGLGAGERLVLTFAGPACAPGTSLTATVDSGDSVDERDEDDNVLVAACEP